ncbi:sulfate transporter subunit, partial [Escherichia coli]|nr:sulfate transporter subunit [Escherichia coli]
MNKWGVGLTFFAGGNQRYGKDIQLLNVSYDPTRDLYEQYNRASSCHWKHKTRDYVGVRQSA